MSNSLGTGYAANALGTTDATNYYNQPPQYSNIFDGAAFELAQQAGHLATQHVFGPAVDQTFDYFQRAYQNYMNSAPSYVQTNTPGNLPQQPMQAAGVRSYMPVQNGGLPGQMDVMNNGGVLPGNGMPQQPNHVAPNPLQANPATHVIDSRSVPDQIDPAQSPHYVSWMDLYNLAPQDFARLTPSKQQDVNAAIERSFPGLYDQPSELVGNSYMEYTLNPNNQFDPAAAQRFTTALTESYKPYDPGSDHYQTTASGLNDLGRHLKQTTEELQSKFPQLPPQYLRRGLWEEFKVATPEIRSVDPFDYSRISTSSIYDRAQTFQTVDDIQGFYRSVTEDQIAGTNRLYANPSDCPSGGLVHWKTEDDLKKNAPPGLWDERSTSSWYRPWSWGTSEMYIKYDKGVQAQFLNGKVAGVFDKKYTVDGVTWENRTSNKAIRSARVNGMERYRNGQIGFFDSGQGRYPNCNQNDIDTLSALNPGDVVPRT
jgi:hypothetical protein